MPTDSLKCRSNQSSQAAENRENSSLEFQDCITELWNSAKEFWNVRGPGMSKMDLIPIPEDPV